MPGDCAPRDHYVTGPLFVRFDMEPEAGEDRGRSTSSCAPSAERLQQHQLHAVAQTGTRQTINQVTAAYRDTNNTQNPGGRLVQFVFRVTW